MVWYSVGTVNVTNNSNSVTGTGVNFTANTRTGDAFIGPDGRIYEVVNIPGSLNITISPNYLGDTATNQAYRVVPVQGYVKASADLLRSATNDLTGRLEALDELSTLELESLDGINGNIQTQLDSKADSTAALEGTPASFTAELLSKLDGLAANAEDNVNAAWNAVWSDAQIWI